MSKKNAVSFEVWKQKETQRMKSIQRQEMEILIDKIRKQWTAQQAKVSKDWEDKEAKIFEGFSRIENVVCEFKAAVSERQQLEKQLEALEAENDQLKQVPSDAPRQERLMRINNLRLEIQQLEEDLTRSDAELRAANESKNRYKRLFLESNKVLHEMVEEEKKHSSRHSSRRARP